MDGPPLLIASKSAEILAKAHLPAGVTIGRHSSELMISNLIEISLARTNYRCMARRWSIAGLHGGRQ